MRNALRGNVQLVDQYARLKNELTRTLDRSAYTETKGPFIQGVMRTIRQGRDDRWHVRWSAGRLTRRPPMHEVATEIQIDASAAQVWDVLVDFAAHPDWNPFVRRISGEARAGTRLLVHVQPPGGRGMTFRPKVITAVPGQELRWLGRLLVPGLFDGEHYFRIVPLDGGGVRFIHGERFSGLLVGLAKASLDTGTRAGFEAMNRALKMRAEGPAHVPAAVRGFERQAAP